MQLDFDFVVFLSVAKFANFDVKLSEKCLEIHFNAIRSVFLPAAQLRRSISGAFHLLLLLPSSKFAPGGLKLHTNNNNDHSKVIRIKLMYHRCLFKAMGEL